MAFRSPKTLILKDFHPKEAKILNLVCILPSFSVSYTYTQTNKTQKKKKQEEKKWKKKERERERETAREK